MDSVIDYLYQRNDRLVVPIYECVKELDFACMGHISLAKSFGFSSYMAGKAEKLHPAGFTTVREAKDYPWQDSINPEFVDNALKAFSEWRARFQGPLGGGCFGPLTITSDILGVDYCTRLALKNPEMIYAVIKPVTEFIIELAKKEKALGADFFWIAEPLASLFSPELFMPLCGEYLKQIFDNCGNPGFLHVCGQTTHHTLEMVKTGAQVFSVDWMTDLPRCLAMVPEDIVIMGNVAPMIFLEEEAPAISQTIQTLLNQTKDYKNFILSSGCQIPRIADPAKVQLFFDLANATPLWTNDEYRLIRKLSKMNANDMAAFFDSQTVSAEIRNAAIRMAVAEKATLG